MPDQTSLIVLKIAMAEDAFMPILALVEKFGSLVALQDLCQLSRKTVLTWHLPLDPRLSSAFVAFLLLSLEPINIQKNFTTAASL